MTTFLAMERLPLPGEVPYVMAVMAAYGHRTFEVYNIDEWMDNQIIVIKGLLADISHKYDVYKCDNYIGVKGTFCDEDWFFTVVVCEDDC